MKSMSLTLAAVLLVPSFVSAQALPFTKRPVSQEEYALAVDNNDRSVLNASCVELVKAANAVFGSTLEICSDLGAYIRQLSVRPCPTAHTTVARILPGGEIDLRGYSRELREGEQCLYENNSARWFASLSCGNFITQDLPVYTAMVAEKPPEAAAASTAEKNAAEAVNPAAEELSDAVAKAAAGQFLPQPFRVKIEKDEGPPAKKGWFQRNWKWVVPLAVGAGVGAALASLNNTQEVTVTNVFK